MAERIEVRSVATSDLSERDLRQMRELLWAAFPGEDGFTEDDWRHAMGGTHFLADRDGVIVSHAAVIEREIHVGGVALRTGYVEGVGTLPEHQGQGYGTAVMRAATQHILETYEFGALGTGEHGFYERFGWETWKGRAYVRTPDGPERTPDEEGAIMVLRTPSTPSLDPEASISCDWRPGDVW
ncbi:MAG TPA: GNAT family N-acetyltransferase [Candidatus Limnocylindrales bacterium]|nr:GNAT family N-acetyltransferase [Candidatus Limnocylindrales bacterium]